jgi:hypothetical protein
MKRKGGMKGERKKISYSSHDFLDDNDALAHELKIQKEEHRIKMKEARKLLAAKNETLGVLLDTLKRPSKKVIVMIKN